MEPGSKYFFIKSQLNGLVLDARGGGSDAGTQIITWEKKPDGFDNQLFFEDAMTGTIRPKHAPHLVLDVPDDGANTLVLSECSGSSSQKWVCHSDGRISSREDGGRVLDIAAANQDPGARICAWQDNSNPHQRWTFDYQPRDYFFIRSKLNGLVLDIKGGDAAPGAAVITWGQKDGDYDNQLWYEDCHGYIRSKLNSLVYDSSDYKVHMSEYCAGNEHHSWCRRGEFISNPALSNKSLDIRAGERDPGADVIYYDHHGKENQQWEFDFI